MAVGSPALDALRVLDNTCGQPTLHHLASLFATSRDASAAAANDCDALNGDAVRAVYARHHASLVSPLALAAGMLSPGPAPMLEPEPVQALRPERLWTGEAALSELVLPRFFPGNDAAASAAMRQLGAFRSRTGAFADGAATGADSGSFWADAARQQAAPELTTVARRLCGAFGGVAGADRRRREASLLDVPAEGGARLLEVRVDAYQRRAQDFAGAPSQLDLIRAALGRPPAAVDDSLRWAEWDDWLRGGAAPAPAS